jgi:hypothetical protein
MTSRFSTRVLLLAIIVASAVGVLDAVIGRVWDHVALFGLVVALAALLLARTNWRRRTVLVRRDHARWLATRAQLTGEDVEHVTDRALATYRRALDGDATRSDHEPDRAPGAG